MKKGTLNHHLNVLEESGLIRNFSKGSPLEPYHSFYELTPLAERTIEALFGAFSPQRPEARPLSAAISEWTTVRLVALGVLPRSQEMGGASVSTSGSLNTTAGPVPAQRYEVAEVPPIR